MAKISDRNLIYLALHEAIEWQRGLADAYSHIEDAPERTEALERVRQYRSILRKRYGRDTRPGQEMLNKAPLVSLAEIETKHKSR